jgi:predicted XRE-type DNA-binding protein
MPLPTPPEEAANLRARAELIDALWALVKTEGWTRVEAARRFGMTQPRMEDLMRSRISRLSLEALSGMAVEARPDLEQRRGHAVTSTATRPT